MTISRMADNAAESPVANGDASSTSEKTVGDEPKTETTKGPVAVTAPVAASNPTETASTTFRGQPDDFYNAIFYFSGMGSVIGSALAEGVYVAEQYRKNAIDVDDLQKDRQAASARTDIGASVGRRGVQPNEDVVITARGQAQNLSTDLQNLHTLLEPLPVFTGNANQLPPTGSERRGGEIEQPIHGELYFRCKERFPVQPSTPSSRPASRQTQQSPIESQRSRASFDAVYQTEEVRRRRNYDDAVLADVARAAVDAFPLLPAPRQPSSRGSATPVKELDDQASRKARRRDVNATVATAASPLTTGGYQQQQQVASRVY